MGCEECGGALGHPRNGDWTCKWCKLGVSSIGPGSIRYRGGREVRKGDAGWAQAIQEAFR